MPAERTRKQTTDWDLYYKSVPATAGLTRKYTTAVLLNAIRRFAKPRGDAGLSIVELGGGNSCFLDAVMAEIRPSSYDIIDTNEYGLSLLAERIGGRGVRLHRQNVLELSYDCEADVVFSIGLIEHFDAADTRRAVLAHFEPLRPGGIAIISFPTPTLLYRASRRVIEAAGMWRFPDERPLDRIEVLHTVRERGDVVYEKTLWPVVLTQHLVVAKKR